MRPLLQWFDQRTGLGTTLSNWLHRPMAGGPAWRFVWPTAIAFTFVAQAITGMVVWMYYSAGAQSSWESVYFLQYHVMGGWLLRAIHFYMGQATLVLIGIYLLQMIIRGSYRAPREFLFWTVLLMGLVTLGLNLTGDLLSWDQNSYWSSGIRIAYLSHTPLVGPWLSRLVVGGTQFGTFTLTRFLALHIAASTVALLGLMLLHAHLAARHGLESAKLHSTSAVPGGGRGAGGEGNSSAPYWPNQAWRDAVACCIVLAVVVALSARQGISGPQAGIELGAPANPVDDPGTARPEWSFRGLYQLHENLVAQPEPISIMVIPGLAVLIFFAMPLIGKNLAGRLLNIVLALGIFGGMGGLAWMSYRNDAKNEKYQAAIADGRRQAERVKELADGPQKIPASGALTLLRTDAKTQGPRLFNQNCASCHDYSGPDSGITRPVKPTASDLYRFASRDWLTEFLTVQGITSPKYFGNTKFKQKKMYGYIKETYADFPPKEKEQAVAALSHEAGLKSQTELDARDVAGIVAGNSFLEDNCTECHLVHGKGTASGPDLTGYGSHDWLVGIIANPAHKRFYGKENDRMPAFAESATDANKNILSPQDMELLVEWLRGEWYEAETK